MYRVVVHEWVGELQWWTCRVVVSEAHSGGTCTCTCSDRRMFCMKSTCRVVERGGCSGGKGPLEIIPLKIHCDIRNSQRWYMYIHVYMYMHIHMYLNSE